MSPLLTHYSLTRSRVVKILTLLILCSSSNLVAQPLEGVLTGSKDSATDQKPTAIDVFQTQASDTKNLMPSKSLLLESSVSTVNINTASAVDLAEGLIGVGPLIAEAIVAHREAEGDFKQPEDLVAVTGIGQVTMTKNQALIRVK